MTTIDKLLIYLEQFEDLKKRKATDPASVYGSAEDINADINWLIDEAITYIPASHYAEMYRITGLIIPF